MSSLHLELNASQQAELVALRDHADKPYLRERAAALLKIASGQSASQVAASGLHRPRDYHSVCAWVKRYIQDGLRGLQIRSGRGRKPVFSPSERRTGPR